MKHPCTDGVVRKTNKRNNPPKWISLYGLNNILVKLDLAIGDVHYYNAGFAVVRRCAFCGYLNINHAWTSLK